MHWCRLLWLGFLLCLLSVKGTAAVSVPEPLQSWQEWALKDHPDIHCPLFLRTSSPRESSPQTSSAQVSNQRQCQWPGTLHLKVTAQGLHFEQHWQLFMEGRVPLPGGDGYWPESLLVNSVSGLVLDWNGKPAVQLKPSSRGELRQVTANANQRPR